MSNLAKRPRRPPGSVDKRSQAGIGRWALLVAGLGIIAATILLIIRPNSGPAPAKDTGSPAPVVRTPNTATPELPRIEVKQAVMVTVELDFGPVIPSIADALQQI